MGLVISSEFTRKQEFKLKKIERPIYVRNVDSLFNKEGPIKHMVEVNIYYQRHRERMEIDIIEGQKQSVILEILQLARHNPKIDWKTGEVKITRCPEECRKQWKPKQGKPGWQKQWKVERKEEVEKKREEKAEKQNKQKKERTIYVKRIAKKWEIWDEDEEVTKSEVEAKKLVPEKFHKWIKVFDKKQLE